MNELEMQRRVAKILKNEGYDVYLEVPFLSRSIDIVAVKDNEVLTFELKLHNWRKAIIQSSDHLHGADKAFICMPTKKRLNQEMALIAQSKGIGLMVFDPSHETIQEVIPAKHSEFSWKPAKQWLTSSLAVGVGV